MGGRSAKSQNMANDPFYKPVPSITARQNALSMYGTYGPHGEEPILSRNIGGLYGEPVKQQPNNYNNRYVKGLNQAAGIPPWNYGNYYLGNTTVRMMPAMFSQLNNLARIHSAPALGNSNFLSVQPITPCCMPQQLSFYSWSYPYSMPMTAPMIATATPLPVAFNPLIQGMYPSVSTSSINWMTPSSFMSALTSGPMPYRPPVNQFPNNVGAVMTIPYGRPNPTVSQAYSHGTSPHYNMSSSTLANQYNYAPQASVPSATSFSTLSGSNESRPLPISAFQIDQSPTQVNVSATAPSFVVGTQQLASTYTQPVKTSVPVYNPIYESSPISAQNISTQSLNLESNSREPFDGQSNKSNNKNRFAQASSYIKDHFRRYTPSIPTLSRAAYSFTRSEHRTDPILPPILEGTLISDSGWLPKTAYATTTISTMGHVKRKRPFYVTENGKSMVHSNGSRVSFLPYRRRRRRSNSSVSEYDCAICQQKRDEKRLRKYYGSSTVSSLLSLTKPSQKHNLSSNEPLLLSKLHKKTDGLKQSNLGNSTLSKNNSAPPKENSVLVIRQSPVQHEVNDTKVNDSSDDVVDGDFDEQAEKSSNDDNNSSTNRIARDDSEISLKSIEE